MQRRLRDELAVLCSCVGGGGGGNSKKVGIDFFELPPPLCFMLSFLCRSLS